MLEGILWSEVGTKEEYEAEYGKKPLGEFVREIVGMDMAAAKAAFAEYLNDTSLDSRQIYFVNQIVEYIVHNGMLRDLSVLQDTNVTNQLWTIMGVAQKYAGLDSLNVAQQQNLTARMQAWLAFGEEYDIFTMRTDAMESSVFSRYR